MYSSFILSFLSLIMIFFISGCSLPLPKEEQSPLSIRHESASVNEISIRFQNETYKLIRDQIIQLDTVFELETLEIWECLENNCRWDSYTVQMDEKYKIIDDPSNINFDLALVFDDK